MKNNYKIRIVCSLNENNNNISSKLDIMKAKHLKKAK